MAEMLTMQAKEGFPGAPPLFVTVFSEDGIRQEGLLESGPPAPDWLRHAAQVRVETPSGGTWDGHLDPDKNHSRVYERLLSVVGGPKRAWTPDVVETSADGAIAGLEFWTNEPGEASVTEGSLWTFRRYSENPRKMIDRSSLTRTICPVSGS